MNFLVAGVAATRGGLSFDPALPVEDPSLRTGNAVLGYARVIELWGQSAKVDVIVPYTWLSGDAIYAGQPVERVVDGAGDIAFRLSGEPLRRAGHEPEGFRGLRAGRHRRARACA